MKIKFTADEVRSLRKRLKLSRRDLARVLECPVAYVAQVEKGEALVGWGTAAKLNVLSNPWTGFQAVYKHVLKTHQDLMTELMVLREVAAEIHEDDRT